MCRAAISYTQALASLAELQYRVEEDGDVSRQYVTPLAQMVKHFERLRVGASVLQTEMTDFLSPV